MPEFDLGQFTQQFQQMGITDPFSQQNIASAMGQITGREVPVGMVAALTPEMLKGAQKGTYSPLVASKSQNLLVQIEFYLDLRLKGPAFCTSLLLKHML